MAESNQGYVPTTLQSAINWAQKYSLFTYPFATACCAMEFMATMAGRYDIARFGAEFPRFSPRQADLLIVIGTITERQAPILRRVYDQMPDPKWVMAFGVCASTGGFYQNYTVTPGADQIIPVDVYVPGCPPRPEQVLDGLMALQRKIQDHRGAVQREVGNTAAIGYVDRRRLPIIPDGTSMTLDEDERMPRHGRTL
jgi:NADH-quinone oxidoreductase subunit B